jgi:ubiquinone biosynthesis monooxygenase Coq7
MPVWQSIDPKKTPKYRNHGASVAGLQQFVSHFQHHIRARLACCSFYGVSPMDSLLNAADSALRTLFARPHAAQPCPTVAEQFTQLDATESRCSASLMRVNHVGEVCAQALYTAQALSTRNPTLRAHFTKACIEETDHLAWTAQRLAELDARPSLLNPLWYAGAFGLGLLAGRLGDKVSLGFVVETENQVGAHLQSHLEQLPPADHASRAIVSQMRDDELVHAQMAKDAGAMELPQPVKDLMRAAAKVMTTVAHHV